METKQHIKNELRRQAVLARKQLSAASRCAAGAAIAESLFALPEYRNASAVLAYAALPEEVPTGTILSRVLSDKKLLFLPKVEGDEMNFYPVEELSGLLPGAYQIKEPAPSGKPFDFSYGRYCLMLVPGTCFDKKGGRIGFGKGYYDKWLHKHKPDNAGTASLYTVGLSFACQIVREIPMEPHDMFLDCVLTEKEETDRI